MTAGHALIIGNTDGIGLVLTRRLLALGWMEAIIQKRGFSIIPSAGCAGFAAIVTTGLAGQDQVTGLPVAEQAAFRGASAEVM